VACYISNVAQGPYVAIATLDGPICGWGIGLGATLSAAIVGAPSFWYYQIVVVY
jgi:hypothetical protein